MKLVHERYLYPASRRQDIHVALVLTRRWWWAHTFSRPFGVQK